MRGHLITIAALVFIAACALVTFIRISSVYRAPDGPVLPDSSTPAPLVPSSPTASPTATASSAAPASPRPTHTVTVWTTVPASPTGGDGQ
jgi:hypothetical protein